MGFFEILAIGVALSMDAFAVSVCKGLSMRKIDYRYSFIIALYFGGFQALMPALGWIGGSYFKQIIESYDHWIAFLLLAYIGGKMLWDATHPDEDEVTEKADRLPVDHKELLVMAVATSIDALAVGIALAIEDVNILSAATIIGITTFCLSFVGVAVGNRFGSKYENKATALGGLVLIGIGIKILSEHLGFLA
ncbi:MAG: manganese efflux pump [Firmicutes bacterium]|nr:manganese efflux pump [Bacillota bacterium]